MAMSNDTGQHRKPMSAWGKAGIMAAVLLLVVLLAGAIAYMSGTSQTSVSDSMLSGVAGDGDGGAGEEVGDESGSPTITLIPDTRSTEGYAYAIYQENEWQPGTGTLSFVRSEEVYTTGEYQQVSYISDWGTGTQVNCHVYAGIESLQATSANDVPWHDIAGNVTQVQYEGSVKISPASTAHWFEGFTQLNWLSIPFDYSSCTDMSYMFAGSSLNSIDYVAYDHSSAQGYGIPDIYAVDFSNVQNMSHMFENCSNLMGSSFETEMQDYFGADIPAAADMSYMYAGSGLKKPTFGSLDTSNTTNMAHMFDGCTALKKLDLSTFNTSSAANMASMFAGCTSLRQVDLGEDFSFSGSGIADPQNKAVLPDAPQESPYDGTWSLADDASTAMSAAALAQNYNGASMAGWWQWTGFVPPITQIPFSVTDYKGAPSAGYAFQVINDMVRERWELTTDAAGSATLSFERDAGESARLYVSLGDSNGPGSYFYIMVSSDGTLSISQDLMGSDEPTVTLENGTVCIQLAAPPNANYAVYCAEDQSLTFVYSRSYIGYGSTFEGKTVANTWSLDSYQNSTDPFYEMKDASYNSFHKVIIEAPLRQSTYAYLNQWFRNAPYLETIEGAGYLEMTDMSSMFSGCSSLDDLDMSTMDTSDVTSMAGLFSGCTSLSSIALGENFSFTNTNAATLPDPPAATTSGKWKLLGNSPMPKKTSAELISTYDGTTMAGTWVWDRNAMTYAILTSSSDTLGAGHLVLFKSDLAVRVGDDETATDIDGNVYTGKVYGEIGTAVYSEATWPWLNERNNITAVNTVSGQDVSVASCADMFRSFSSVAQIDLSGLDTSGVTDMSGMFAGCSSLSTITFGSKFDTSSVTDMSAMFSGCSSAAFNPNIGNLTTSEVTDMSYMFYGCSGAAFNPSIGGWNTSKVTNMSGMFSNCSGAAFNPSIGGWNTSAVLNMSNMFSGCSGAAFNPSLNDWTTSEVADMSSMFSGCSGAIFNPSIGSWDTSKVATMSNMFYNCSGAAFNPSIGNWNTSEVATMSNMFSGCSGAAFNPSLNGWTTSKVTNMSNMFYNCSGANFNPAIGEWDTSEVQTMSFMFYHCSGAAFNPPIGDWNVSKVTTMSYMFYECRNATFNPAVGNWNVSSVTSMANMFQYAGGDSFAPDFTNWPTTSLTSMADMFHGCRYNGTTLSLSGMDLSHVASAYYTFSYINVNAIDLTNTSFESLGAANCMFAYSSVKTIYVDPGTDWAVSTRLHDMSGAISVGGRQDMFMDAGGLTGGNGTRYNTSVGTDLPCAHVDGLDERPGYFTALSRPYSDLQALAASVSYSPVSADGADIDPNEQWTSQEAKDALDGAVAAAQALIAANADDTDWEAAEAALQAAITAYGAAQQAGIKTVETLSSEIAAAEDNLESTSVSADGADVLPSNNWVTEAVHDAYEDAIDDAKDVVDTYEAQNLDLYDDGIAPLRSATGVFNAAKRGGSAPGAHVKHTMKTSAAVNLSGIAYAVNAAPVTTPSSAQEAEGGRPVPAGVTVTPLTITPATAAESAGSTEYVKVYEDDIAAETMFGAASNFGLPGVYFFEVSESHSGGTSEDATTWSYGAERYMMRVYVTNADGQGGLKYENITLRSINEQEQQGADKATEAAFTSSYIATQELTITKQVEGTFGNTMYEFPFAIYMILPDWVEGDAEDSVSATWNKPREVILEGVDDNVADGDVEHLLEAGFATREKTCMASFALADGESIVFTVPVGTYYMLAEHSAYEQSDSVLDAAAIPYDVDIAWNVDNGAPVIHYAPNLEGTSGAETPTVAALDGTAKTGGRMFTHPNKVMTGWNTQDDNQGTHYGLNADITVNNDMTLYAEWEDAYTVVAMSPTTASPDNSVEIGRQQVAFSDDVFSVCFPQGRWVEPNDSPKLTGRSLEGWYVTDYGSAQRIVVNKAYSEYVGGDATAKTLTVYANWGPALYTVNCDLQEASGEGVSVNSPISFLNYTTNINPQTPDWTGHVFQGWYSEPDGAGLRYGTDFTTVEGLCEGDDQGILEYTLYADWD